MDKVPQCARERSESRIMTFIIQWATYDGATALVGCQKGPFIKDVGKFSRFLSPAPLPSAFQQNAYEGDFLSLFTLTFGPLAHGDTLPTLAGSVCADL